MNSAAYYPSVRRPIDADQGSTRSLTARIIGVQSLGLVVLTIVSFAAGQLASTADAMLAINGAILIAFILLSLANAFALVRSDPYNIWMPMTLFLLSSAVFIGFGPLAHNFGSEGTKTYLALRTINANPFGLNRATTLSLIGVLGVNLGMFVTFAFRASAVVDAIKGPRDIVFSPATLATVFVVSGLFFKYAVVYPASWGLISLTIPGALNTINTLSALGFGLWAYLAVRRGGAAVFFFLLVWGLDFALTTLSFAKRPLVLAMIFPLAGYYLAKRNVVVAGLMGLAVITVYSYSQPMVVYARLSGVEENTANGFSDRAAVISEYLTKHPDVPQQAIYYGSQGWWTRLEFSGKQAFAMDLHDRGQRSHSLENLPTIFIPRIVWPDKPQIRPPGKDFYYLVTGRDNNNMSMTIYADLYWQFGWIGVILITPLVGFAIAIITQILLPEIRRNNFVYFPATLIAMQLVLTGPTKYMINGILPPIPLFFIYILLIRLLASQLRIGRTRYTPAPLRVGY